MFSRVPSLQQIQLMWKKDTGGSITKNVDSVLQIIYKNREKHDKLI